MITGPDPALLTDEELHDAALILARIGQTIAGTPGEPVPAQLARSLDPASRFALEGVETVYLILLAENERRLQVDDAEVLAAFEAFLADPDAEH